MRVQKGAAAADRSVAAILPAWHCQASGVHIFSEEQPPSAIPCPAYPAGTPAPPAPLPETTPPEDPLSSFLGELPRDFLVPGGQQGLGGVEGLGWVRVWEHREWERLGPVWAREILDAEFVSAGAAAADQMGSWLGKPARKLVAQLSVEASCSSSPGGGCYVNVPAFWGTVKAALGRRVQHAQHGEHVPQHAQQHAQHGQREDQGQSAQCGVQACDRVSLAEEGAEPAGGSGEGVVVGDRSAGRGVHSEPVEGSGSGLRSGLGSGLGSDLRSGLGSDIGYFGDKDAEIRGEGGGEVEGVEGLWPAQRVLFEREGPPSPDEVVGVLLERGWVACRTRFDPQAIRTNCPPEVMAAAFLAC